MFDPSQPSNFERPNRRDPCDVLSAKKRRIALGDAAQRQNRQERAGRQRPEPRRAEMLRTRMTLRRKNRRKEGKIRAHRGRSLKLARRVAGNGDEAGLGIRDWGPGRRPMHAVRANPRGERRIASDKKQHPPAGADRTVAPRTRLAARVVVIAIDNGAPWRQCAQDRFGVCYAPAVGQEGEAERRAFLTGCRVASPFERGCCGC